jgi:hypothetical protein
MMHRLTMLYMAGWIVAFNFAQKIFVVRSLINNNRRKGNRLGLRRSSSSIASSSNSVFFGVSQDSIIQSSVQEEESTIVSGQPPYQIAGVDLSTSWIDLVKQNQVSVTTQFRDHSDNDDNDNKRKTMIDYGIRMVEIANSDNIDEKETTSSSTTSDVSTTKKWMFQEYVHQIDGEENSVVRNINSTLSRIQLQNIENGETNSGVVEFKQIGDFVTQLQLLRTLRPPPSKEFIGDVTTSYSTPPPYNPKIDSFVTGPLRLELRPLIGRLQLSISSTSSNTNNNNNSDDDKKNNNLLTTPWDVYHNISPADRRGHFLLMPSLLDKERNWRGQEFTENDCHDMVHLTSTIEPVGSMFLGYNSVGAGASQNHIHCHSWPYPTFGSVKTDDTESTSIGNFGYAVTKVETIYDFYDIDGGVEVSYLKYPVFCVLISSSTDNLDLLGRAVASCLDTIGEAPHNIGFLNRLQQTEEEEDDEEEQDAEYVDVYIFARSKERLDILPTLKMGVSEMMGVFHAQSEDELETLGKIDTAVNEEDREYLSINDDDHGHSHDHDHEEDGSLKKKSAMEQALADISFEDEEDLWQRITENLATL